MHELALVEEVVRIVTEGCEGGSVKRVVLEVGPLSAVLPDALRFCFDLAAQGTAAEGATLEIVDVPATARCRECGTVAELKSAFGCCPCGAVDLEWLSGDGLRVTAMEVV